MKTINIIVEGGVILSVDNIPEGVEVRVKDFDVEGADPDRITISKESGDGYFDSLWEHQPDSLERRKQNRTLYKKDGTVAGYMASGYYIFKDRRRPEGIKSIWDNGGETLDRYSVLFVEQENNGLFECLGLSETGAAFSQFTMAAEGDHLGKLVQWKDLEKKLQEHILGRLKTH